MTHQVFSPERSFRNIIEQHLIPLDPNTPECETPCIDMAVSNIQEEIAFRNADAISDEDLQTMIENRGTLDEFCAQLITDLNIVLT